MDTAAPDHRPTRQELESPTDMPKAGWVAILKRSVKQFKRDSITDRAAALTYFGVLAIFPAVLVLVSILGLIGPDSAQQFLDSVKSVAPGGVTTFFSSIIDQVQGKAGAASLAAVVGILIALWSASGYIAAFMRAANAVYEVGEGRPFYKTIPVRILTTIAVVIMLIICVVIVVITGPIADRIGSLIGVGGAVQWVWAIAKWPVLIIIVALLFSLLYAVTPNVKQPRFRWLTPGGLLAVVVWLIVSGLFGLYVSFSGSYNKTYGSLATVIVFLVWLWISNIAILLGLEFDSETERERVIRAGMPADVEPYVRVRDDRKLDERDRARVQRAARLLPDEDESPSDAADAERRTPDPEVPEPQARSGSVPSPRAAGDQAGVRRASDPRGAPPAR
jgi:membrane protein